MTSLLSFPILYCSTSERVILPNEKVISQLKVLDNEVKLQILALLADTGAKSITDISRILNLNFSTAHKYLEQLERVGLVRSQQETCNRLKRMFYIQNFMINLTPRNISTIIRGEAVDLGDEQYGKFNIITHSGKLERFDKYKFAKLYLDAGVPKNSIEIVFDSIKTQIYDGITWAELETLFVDTLKNRAELIWKVVNKINDERLRENTFSSALSLRLPAALETHKSGEIFIQNLSNPRLLNMVHDIRGISVHGVDGSAPEDSAALFKAILSVVSDINEKICKKHALPSFNYLISPHAKLLKRETLTKFLQQLDAFKVDINIDIGVPEFAREMPIKYFGSEDMYLNYVDVADSVSELMMNIFGSEKFNNLRLIIKHNDLESNIKPRNGLVVSSGGASNYVSDTKISSSWKGWMMSSRVGEAQKISINIPKLIKEQKDNSNLKNKLQDVLELATEIHIKNAEMLLGNLLNSNIIFDSAIRKRWDYLHINEFVYSIALHGLSCLEKDKQVELVKLISSIINKLRHDKNLRLVLKLETNPIVIARFNQLNGTKHGSAYIPELKELLDGGYSEE
jgi:DNA-binding transcriptional ArsR family regulator